MLESVHGCVHVCVVWCGVVCVRACMHVGAHVCHQYVQVRHSLEPCPTPVVPAVVQRTPSFSGTPFASRGHSGTVCWTAGTTEVVIVMS